MHEFSHQHYQCTEYIYHLTNLFIPFSSHWWRVFLQVCAPFSLSAIPVCLCYTGVLSHNSRLFFKVTLLRLVLGAYSTAVVLGGLCVASEVGLSQCSCSSFPWQAGKLCLVTLVCLIQQKVLCLFPDMGGIY